MATPITLKPPIRPGTDAAAKNAVASDQVNSARRAQYLEVRGSVHRKLLAKLNLEKLATAERSRVEAEIRALVSSLIAEAGVPLIGHRARRHSRRRHRRSLRLWSSGAAAAGQDDYRHPREHTQAGLRRTGRPAGTGACGLSRTISICCASSTGSSAASDAASTTALRWSTRVCPTALV